MMTTEARRHESKSDEQGLTMVELLVTVAISSIVMAAAAATAISVLGLLHTTEVRTRNVSDARVGIEAISRDMRAATSPTADLPAFSQAEDDNVTFFTLVGSSQELTRVEVSRDGDELAMVRTVVNVTDAGVVTDTGDQTERVITRGLVNDEDTPVFTYLTQTDAGLESLAAPVAAPTTIRHIEMNLLVASDQTERAHPTLVPTSVHLPNLQD